MVADWHVWKPLSETSCVDFSLSRASGSALQRRGRVSTGPRPSALRTSNCELWCPQNILIGHFMPVYLCGRFVIDAWSSLLQLMASSFGYWPGDEVSAALGSHGAKPWVPLNA